ncbi:MAG: hypothetical protein ACLPN6_16045 [Streptosporangiaceae bacterium]
MVAHAGRVVLEVAQGRIQLVFRDALEREDAGGLADPVDIAVVQVLQAGGEPFVFLVAEDEFQLAGEVVEVLAGVEQAGDLGGLGEFRGGDAPDPGRASPRMVSWRTWSAPRRMPSALTRPANVLAGSKVAMTLAESRSRTG